MTCFWDNIMNSLSHEDYNLLGFDNKPNSTSFITKLKEKNTEIQTLWQGMPLSTQEKKEHSQAIQTYNISTISNGHLTSTCDSFLLLLCQLLNLDIHHNYLQLTTIIYSQHNKNPRKTLKFQSTRTHFSTQ